MKFISRKIYQYFALDQAIITRKNGNNALLGVAAGIVAEDCWLTTKNNL